MRISDWSSDVCSSDLLVEEENRRRRLELLHLAQQEVDQRGLAGTGLADDHGVGDRLLPEGVLTGVGGEEVEVVRLAIGGLQGRDAVAPGVVLLLAAREVVQRRKAVEIEGTDVSQARTVLPVARERGIERGHNGQVLLGGEDTGTRRSEESGAGE